LWLVWGADTDTQPTMGCLADADRPAYPLSLVDVIELWTPVPPPPVSPAPVRCEAGSGEPWPALPAADFPMFRAVCCRAASTPASTRSTWPPPRPSTTGCSARTTEQAAQLRERATAGERKSVLAAEYGISSETVYAYLRPAATAP
jgi:hypothetical protein